MFNSIDLFLNKSIQSLHILLRYKFEDFGGLRKIKLVVNWAQCIKCKLKCVKKIQGCSSMKELSSMK